MDVILKYLTTPSNLIILSVVVGLLLYSLKRYRSYARYFFAIAMVIYVVFATGPVSFWLLGRLEYQYPYLDEFTHVRGIRHIVVLAAYADNDLNLPLSSRVNSSAAFRLMEARRIKNEMQDARIIITGTERIAVVMKEVLISLGVDGREIVIETESASTYESARNLMGALNGARFVLVTSAGHMPRSMMVFAKAGMEPIPAPTDYLTFKNYMAISYLPSPLHLQNSDLAIHEYVGIFWYKIMGRI